MMIDNFKLTKIYARVNTYTQNDTYWLFDI